MAAWLTASCTAGKQAISADEQSDRIRVTDTATGTVLFEGTASYRSSARVRLHRFGDVRIGDPKIGDDRCRLMIDREGVDHLRVYEARPCEVVRAECRRCFHRQIFVAIDAGLERDPLVVDGCAWADPWRVHGRINSCPELPEYPPDPRAPDFDR